MEVESSEDGHQTIEGSLASEVSSKESYEHAIGSLHLISGGQFGELLSFFRGR